MEIGKSNPGDTIAISVECGFCKIVMVEDMTEFYRVNNLPFSTDQIGPEAMDHFLWRRGADIVLTSMEATVRCSTCKKLGVTTHQQMITIPKVEYERLLDVEEQYKQLMVEKDVGRVNY